jgi:YD repeat-containing protein
MGFESGIRPEPNFPVIPGYEITAELGRGGMGVVYQARQLKLNRIVALKMVLAGAHASDRSRARFLAEAEIAAGLQHSNIVQIYELGEYDGLPFIAMEFVTGGGMAEWIARRRGKYAEVAELFEKLARAAHWAHQRSIVHRDLKPANVLIGGDGEPKIGDFGLAKRLDDSERPRLTLSGEKMGTPDYMAPEQAFNELGAVSPATDVYALGAMLYQALCGQVPIKGRSEMDWLRQLQREDPPSPAYYSAGIPRDLETICMKCLRKRPSERYASAEALAEDLRRFRNFQPIEAKPLSTATKCWRWVKRRAPKIAAVSIILGALAAGGLWWRHQYLYVWEVTEHFRKVERHHGEYVGHGEPLASSALARRQSTWRLVRAGHRGQLKRVDVVNSDGNPRWFPNGGFTLPDVLKDLSERNQPCTSVLAYDTRGLVSEERWLDCSGRDVLRIRYSYPNGFQREQSLLPITFSFLDEGGTPLKAESGVGGLQVYRDKAGFDAVVVFTDSSGAPIKNSSGVHAMRVERDAKGLPVTETNLDLQSQPLANQAGWMRCAVEYDALGQITRRTFFGTDDKPAAGVAVITHGYDSWGNLTRTDHFSADGRTPARDGEGKTTYRAEYDDRGRLKTEEWSGFDPARSGYAALATEYRWNAQTGGTLRTRTYKDANGKAASRHGAERFEEELDPSLRVLRVTTDGWDPKKVGFAKSVDTLSWHDGDYPVERVREYYDEAGRPTQHQEGNGRYTMTYNEAGEVIREVLDKYVVEKQPLHRKVTEYTRTEARQEGQLREGFVLRAEDLGIESTSELKNASRRAAGWRRPGGKKEWKIQRAVERFEDRTGRPVPGSEGFSEALWEYDAQGRIVSVTKSGFDFAKLGFSKAVIATEWTTEGSISRKLYFNDRDERVRGLEGCIDQVEYYDRDEQLQRVISSGFPSTVSYSVERKEFLDWRGGFARRVNWFYEDSDGKPIRYNDEYFEYIQEFDDRRFNFRVTTVGHNPELEPYHTRVQERSPAQPDGSLREAFAYRTDSGEPARGPWGELREERLVRADRTLHRAVTGFDLQRHGFERGVMEFDARGHFVSVQYFDAAGKPIENLKVYARFVSPRGMAMRLGLKAGDQMISYNGTPITSSFQMTSGIPLTGGTLEIVRDGEPKRFENVPAGRFMWYLEDRAAR